KEGIFYDGKSSDRHPVAVCRDGDRLRITGEGLVLAYDVRRVVPTPPLGRTRRSLLLPDGAVCELADGAAVAELLPAAGGRLAHLVHRWERSLVLAGVALALTVLLVWGFVRFGIPVLARQVAFAIPPAMEQSMGTETMAILDRMLFAPTQLPAGRQEEVRALFHTLREDLPDAAGYRLDFRHSAPLGANALALPSGIIVVTDDFVHLAAHDEEIVAVLAHEVSHVRRRHALRQVLQNSAAGLLVASLSGDLTSMTSLAAALPAALVDARYSRLFEMEADDDAADYLARRGIAVGRFADILDRLQAAHEKRHGTSEGRQPLGDLFATHPETQRRIARILAGRPPE
ncbi:MAG: M48 family metallopeptidase, partial [Desulfuromonadales bacterium]